jgi:hypothetical protein
MSVLQYSLMGVPLAVALALFGVIIVLRYAWYPDVVREQLGTFVAEGRTLLGIVQMEQEPAPLHAADEWKQRVMDYLALVMGRSFVHRFDDDASHLPVGESTLQSDTHRQLELDLRLRIARLERFLSERGPAELSAALAPASRLGPQSR